MENIEFVLFKAVMWKINTLKELLNTSEDKGICKLQFMCRILSKNIC